MREAVQRQREWQQASRLVVADFKGLLAFRQFKLSATVDEEMRDWSRRTRFHDDFTLRALFNDENWRPRDNRARCHSRKPPHPVPSLNCTCGYYASYSSSIIYRPDKLGHKYYCFAAIRMYGENLPLAQNGLRSSGADVAGILFSRDSLGLPSVQNFIKQLVKEDIFYTFSAREFLRRFPDQSYADVLNFDPVKRWGEHRHLGREPRPYTGARDHWETIDYSEIFYRPVRPEMLLRRDLEEESTARDTYYEVTIKPEYRPGGLLYQHPLLEVWEV